MFLFGIHVRFGGARARGCLSVPVTLRWNLGIWFWRLARALEGGAEFVFLFCLVRRGLSGLLRVCVS